MRSVPEQRARKFRGRSGVGRKLAMVCGAVALAVISAACSSSSSPSSSSTASSSSSFQGGTTASASSSQTVQKGGTATYALPPSTTPNYIFPFASSQYFSVDNTAYLQYLLYRPLYWFGQGASPTVNPSLSLADPPVFNGKQVTITLKGWKWSNGESVDAADVVFWINMLKAVGTTDWGAYTPGGFPDNVSNVKAVNADTVTMTMDKAYNQTWFTDNELSQITPLPLAWDVTASGPSDCATVVADCAKVYAYLNTQAQAMSKYVGSPIWSVVDGPWKLSSFNADGNNTFVPNPDYSGTAAILSKFVEVPFTTEDAEYNVLQASASGGSGQTVDVGYLPTTDAPAKPANAAVGSNPVNGYTLDPLYSWGINYFVVNEQSTTGNGPVLDQTYFRQDLENLVDQQAIISGPLKGYGQETVGPVGSYPATDYLSTAGKSGSAIPAYSSSAVAASLTSHGWTVVPNGTTTCTDPAKCGAGVKQGQKLAFTLPYATGTTWIEQEMTELQSNASLVGIKISLKPEQFNQVISVAGGNCVVTKSSCAWDMANWGGGWTFNPDYYPSGETLFMSGAGANSGGYKSTEDDSLINETLTSNSLSTFYNWQDYLAPQDPVIWQPNGVYELTEVINNLKGVVPQDTTLAITPETWYFTK